MKKTVSLLLCLTVIMGAVAILSGCESKGKGSSAISSGFGVVEKVKEESHENFEYKEFPHTVEIKKYIGDSKKVVIPSKIGDKDVDMIAEGAFSGCDKVEEVTLPESLAYSWFLLNVFENCNSLKTITFSGKAQQLIYATSLSETVETLNFSSINNKILKRQLVKALEERNSIRNINIKEVEDFYTSGEAPKIKGRTITFNIPKEVENKILQNKKAVKEYDNYSKFCNNEYNSIHLQSERTYRRASIEASKEYLDGLKSCVNKEFGATVTNISVTEALRSHKALVNIYAQKGGKDLIIEFETDKIHVDDKKHLDNFSNYDVYNVYTLSEVFDADENTLMCMNLGCESLIVNGKKYEYTDAK